MAPLNWSLATTAIKYIIANLLSSWSCQSLPQSLGLVSTTAMSSPGPSFLEKALRYAIPFCSHGSTSKPAKTFIRRLWIYGCLSPHGRHVPQILICTLSDPFGSVGHGTDGVAVINNYAHYHRYAVSEGGGSGSRMTSGKVSFHLRK